MAAFGWEGQDQTALEDACRLAGDNLVAITCGSTPPTCTRPLPWPTGVLQPGTLGIISNEGNARLTTTLPRVHVALVGVDKLVPHLHSALRILKILPARATGLVGEEGAIFHWTFLHSAGMCAIIAVLTLLQAYWFRFMLP